MVLAYGECSQTVISVRAVADPMGENKSKRSTSVEVDDISKVIVSILLSRNAYFAGTINFNRD